MLQWVKNAEQNNLVWLLSILDPLTTLVMEETQGGGTLSVTKSWTTVSCKDCWVVLHPGREVIPMADRAMSSRSNNGCCFVCFVFFVMVLVRICHRPDRVDCAVRMDIVG
jgi:hypothetical protein